MELRTLARRVLDSASLETKLAPVEGLTDEEPGAARSVPEWPARSPDLRLDRPQSQAPFPRLSQLDDPQARGRVLHFFANHELLAMELMAAALLRFPEAPRGWRLGMGQVLLDEQAHMRLYLSRMEALGVRFGELPVSPFLERVYRDEIRHVAHGLRWFRRWKEPEESDWDAFVRELEVPLSPARARGRVLDREGRRQAGLDEDFVQRLEVFSRSRGRPPWVYSFNPGVEDEAAGRVPSKAARTLRRDLAALPHVLAGADDIVLAPPQRPEFLLGLKEAGFALPEFRQEPPGDRAVAGARPFGVPGEHLRRSRIATLRDDVALCRSMTDVREATLRMGRVVLKSEFSSSGRGIRWGWDAQAERWAEKRLQQDGVVLVEPWLDIVVELSGLFWEGRWQGLSQPIVEGGRWCGHWLGALLWGLPRELHRFVFEGRRVEKVLRALDLPETCGVDVAVVRSEEGLALRLLELNARTTMGHYALALKKRVPTHRYFRFVRLSELAHLDAIHLTDPEMASTWCAVLER